MKIPGIKIPRVKKFPNPGDFPEIPGISRKSRKNPDRQKIVKTKNFFLYFLKVFQKLKISKVLDKILDIQRSFQL